MLAPDEDVTDVDEDSEDERLVVDTDTEDGRNSQETSLLERFSAKDLARMELIQANLDFFHLARRGATAAEIENVIARGASVRTVDRFGQSALHIASKCGHLKLTRLLLRRYGADQTLRDLNGLTPVDVSAPEVRKVFFEAKMEELHKAARDGDLARLRELWSNLDQTTGLDESVTPIVLLHIAAENGRANVTHFLLDVKKVPVNGTTAVGRTALHYAVDCGRIEVIRMLLEHGADPLKHDVKGHSSIHMASSRLTQRILERAIKLRSSIHHHHHGRQGVDSDMFASFSKDFWSRSRYLIDGILLIGFIPEGSNNKENGMTSVLLDAFPYCLRHGAKVYDINQRAEVEMDLKQYERPSKSLQSLGLRKSIVQEAKTLAREAADYFLLSAHAQPMNRWRFQPKFTTFVLTDSDGSRSYCCILTFHDLAIVGSEENDAAPRTMPKCLCLLSRWSLLTMHRAFLFDLHAVAFRSSNMAESSQLLGKNVSVESMLDAMVGVQVPRPGGDPVCVDSGTRNFSLFLPPRKSLPLIDDMCFDVLFACLSPKNVLAVLAALLAEQSVLMFCDTIELLFPICEALLALLFPFEWCHTYIPVLPLLLLDVTQAPFPFLVGMQTGYLDRVGGDRLSSLLLVNVDRDMIIMPIEPEYPLMASKSVRSVLDKRRVTVEAFPEDIYNPLLGELEQWWMPIHQRPTIGKVANVIGSSAEFSASSSIGTSRLSFHEEDVVEKFTNDQEKGSSNEISISLYSASRSVGAVRAACVRAMVELIGEACLHEREVSSNAAFIESQPENRRQFLRLLLHSQLWQCFVDDMNHGANKQSREAELGLFKHFVDEHLRLQKYVVHAHRVFCYAAPKLTAAIVGCKNKSEVITVLSSKALPSGLLWIKLREISGWCLVNPKRDIHVYDDAASHDGQKPERYHYGNSDLYPYQEHNTTFETLLALRHAAHKHHPSRYRTMRTFRWETVNGRYSGRLEFDEPNQGKDTPPSQNNVPIRKKSSSGSPTTRLRNKVSASIFRRKSVGASAHDSSAFTTSDECNNNDEYGDRTEQRDNNGKENELHPIDTVEDAIIRVDNLHKKGLIRASSGTNDEPPKQIQVPIPDLRMI